MGQEAYAMFPALARMQAETQLAKAQAGAYGIEAQKFQQGNNALTAFGSAFGNGPLPGAQPGPIPQAPAPGQASMPMNPYATGGAPDPGARVGGMGQAGGVRVPQPTSPPAMGGMVATGGTPAGTEDQLTQPGDSGAPPAVPAPAAAPAQPGTPHKWTAAPGEQNNTPDGSRPRSLDDVMGALKKANPKADPATLARAAALYMPWMTEEDQVLLRQEMMKNTAAMNALRVGGALERTQLTEGGKDTRLATTEAGKDTRLTKQIDASNWRANLRNDARTADRAQRLDELDQKLQAQQDRLELSKSTEDRRAFDAILAAKHAANVDAINLMFVNQDIDQTKKDQLLANVDQEWTDASNRAAQIMKKATPPATFMGGKRRVADPSGNAALFSSDPSAIHGGPPAR